MSKKLKVRVFHGYYGCETGCCGHFIEVEDDSGKTVADKFEFSHPYDEEAKQWATELAQKYILEKHPDCYDTIDWDSIEFKDVTDNCW